MRSVSHPFAYHGLPSLLQLVILVSQAERPHDTATSRPRHLAPGLTLEDFHPVIHAQFLGVQFT